MSELTASPKPLKEQAYEYLVARIHNCELPPGAKIREAQMAAAIGLSRTPLREALSRLEREGYVRLDQAKGYSVSELTEREARETYPILAALEVVAVEESGTLLESTLERLKEINDALAQAKDSIDAINLDSLWHDTLISRCLNQRLLRLIANYRKIIFRYESLYMADPNLIVSSTRQHSAIIDAIARGSLAETRTLILKNYRHGMEAVLQKMACAG